MGTAFQLARMRLLLLSFYIIIAYSQLLINPAAAVPTRAFVGQLRRASASSSTYLTTIKLGTPPQILTLALNTDAYITSTSTFDPNKSSSYHRLPAGSLSSDSATLNSTDGFVPTVPLKLNGIEFQLLTPRKLVDLQLNGIKFLQLNHRKNVLNGIIMSRRSKDVLALGADARAFPAQIFASARVARKFAYCLSGSNTVATPIFFGSTSYYFDSGLPPFPGNDRYPEFNITPLLIYTPLIKPAQSKRGYALQITSIEVVDGSVGGSPVEVNDTAAIGITSALYTRIVEPAYTQIREAFLRVPAVTGFPRVDHHHGALDLCFNITTVGQYRSAPLITFTFGGNASVAITADNYLLEVGDTTIYCFALISGGTRKGNSAIGTFQQQDNLVEYDLERKRVGFTGSLIAVRSNCGNFNFTAT